MTAKFRIAMFSGGRGTHSITEALMKHAQIELILLVNTYDDGLSTGALRRFVPGMLGPSDVRKNIARLIDPTDRADRAFKFLLEYRFPQSTPAQKAIAALTGFAKESWDTLEADIHPYALDLNHRQTKIIAGYARAFIAYYDEQIKAGKLFEFSDCSLGNLFFTGCFLQSNRSFNEAIDAFSKVSPLRGQVLNVTAGENLVLVALKKDNTYLADEAAIVSIQDATPIEEIFLLPNYLTPDETTQLRARDHRGALEFLGQRAITPKMNPQAKSVLESADMIIYGPGTQHSSLFPSYFTQDLAAAIARNTAAEKIFVGNIYKDYEIRNETAASLVNKLFFYLNSKGKNAFSWNQLVTLFFLQNTSPATGASSDYVFFDPATFPYPLDTVVLTDWETKDRGHSGGMVVDEIVSVVNSKLQKKLKPFPHTVSIIVPALNEERTLATVLKDLTQLNLTSLDLGKQIIVVDGGSTDHTLELARKQSDIEIYTLPKPLGRGAALRMGIEKATGNICVFYPSDAEYSVNDLLQIIQEVSKNEFQVVFGSRAIKCVNVSQRILDIYQGNYLMYFMSKYGGMLVSSLSLVLYNRFISDVFTGIKAFDTRLLKSLKLTSNGLNLETEIVGKLGRRGLFILELPVDYWPRTRKQGKKTTVWDGIVAILSLIYHRFSPQ